MSSELDKFVLQYSVDLKDAIQRLEQLNEKVKKTSEEANHGKKEFEEFASGASDELARIIPGVDKLSNAVKTMRGQFVLAGVAVGALAVGVKAVMNYREQLSQQRQTGMDVGVSGVRLEEYQRKFVKNSDGNVSREQTAEGVRGFTQFLTSAYTDPTRMGTEARTLRMLGIDPGARGKGQTSTNSALTQLATKFQGMSPQEVQGIAESLNMSKDFALTLRKLGPSVGKVTEMSSEEIQKRTESEKTMTKFNDTLAQMNEKFKEIEQILAQKLLPGFAKLVGYMDKFAGWLPKGIAAAEQAHDVAGSKAVTTGIVENMIMRPGLFSLWDKVKNSSWMPDFLSKKNEDKPVKPIPVVVDPSKGKDPDKGPEKVGEAADKLIDQADKSNASGKQIASDMQLAINMFSGAVATFANAIDERQAWASWAGEIGRAAGLGTRAAADNAIPSGQSSKYDGIIEREAAKFGISADLVRRVIKAESSFNPNAVSSVGAEGLMQLMPANKRALGVTNSFDPEQNIMGGVKLLAENLKATGGNIREALMMYHAGPDRTGWGPKTRAYPDKVLGTANPTDIGESRSKMQLTAVQENMAARLGVPSAQLRLGGVNRGDVDWTKQQLEAGYQNQIADLHRQLQTVGLPQQQRSALMTELREQQTGLELMRKYADQVVGQAQPGDRSITIGERAIVINVNGSGDPSKTSEQVMQDLREQLHDIAVSATTGIKH